MRSIWAISTKAILRCRPSGRHFLWQRFGRGWNGGARRGYGKKGGRSFRDVRTASCVAPPFRRRLGRQAARPARSVRSDANCLCPNKKAAPCGAARCRSGPISRVLSSKTVIYLGHTSPCASSRLPACTERLNRIACLFALASDGVYLSHAVTNVLVRSYRTFSAFLLTRNAPVGV